MDSIKDMLLSRNLEQPSELIALKKYLEERVAFDVSVHDGPRGTTLYVKNGKEAYFLKTKLPEIEQYCAPTKKLYIGIHSTA